MDTQDLNDIMEQVTKGDKDAFRHLSQALGQRMFAQAYRLMSQDREMAEDAVQDALIKLWRTAPNWKPTGRVEGYAARLVYTSCMDLHRRKKPVTELPETVANDDSPFEDYAGQQRREYVLMALEKLPERQRAAIQLFYYSDYSHREVAAVLKTSEKAVESLLGRARVKLADVLPNQLNM